MSSAPVVTALRARGRGQVEIELDGVRWRAVPLEAVHRAGLAAGVELDRARARELARALRRQRALGVALGALRYRDHTATSLEQRLVRRGVPPLERRQALETLSRAGLVDDARFSRARAAALAERGAGDLLIADDLERREIAPDLIAAALDGLEPEAARAARLAEVRGISWRTVRQLTAKGFSEAALEPLVAQLDDGALG